jgi:two-component system, OmpR family, sensor histidine kinase KdpD
MSDVGVRSEPPRGRLRVYLGAAPGVGKTFKMLEEGRRRRDRGTDVVVGIVETHGRPRTAELVDGFEVVPRLSVEHRGTVLHELDVDAVIIRHPELVLVDEFAHSNAPGSRDDKRWQDVDEILDAGIDVITTLNIQHLDSLKDALIRITGVEQRETVPDDVVRRADQIELIDMAPEALRRRISHGNVYKGDKVDAALGNYFRIGNLTALRELALLWVADRVDDELLDYRAEQGIRRSWETRERIIVAITGSTSGEALIRRAARMAERSRAELLGVHVRRSDGLGSVETDEVLARHRALLGELGGHYHEIVGDDAGDEMVRFARSENATQLVLGTSRRGRFDELFRGSIINSAIRASPDIDVHVVANAPDDESSPPVRVRGRGGTWAARRATTRHRIPRRRWIVGWTIALVGPPLLTLAFLPFRADEGLPGVLPAYMLLVVVSALIGGTAPALCASVLGFTIGNLVLTRPYGTLRITELASIVALISFLTVGVIVAIFVGRLGVRTSEAERARAQARALASASASLIADDPVPDLLDRLRTVLGLGAVAVIAADESIIAGAGDLAMLTGNVDRERADMPDGRALVTSRQITHNDDRTVLRAFGDQLAAALRRRELSDDANRMRALDEIDRFRTALLRSVSHDLRTPLASIKAAASSLQQDDVEWPPAAREEFLSTIVEEGDRLDRIVANLLDASRLEAGVLSVDLQRVRLDELVESVTRTTQFAESVQIDIDIQTPPVRADAALLERVVENLVANAIVHAGGIVRIDVAVEPFGDTVRLRIIDHGAGVPPASMGPMFDGFQRLDDRSPGVGLGLAVAQGFVEAMGGALTPTDTAGGGLTMEIELPIDRDDDDLRPRTEQIPQRVEQPGQRAERSR